MHPDTIGDPPNTLFVPAGLRQSDLEVLQMWYTARWRYLFYKSCLDRVLAVVFLVMLALPMLLIALLVRLDSPGPAIYAQKRVGARAHWRDGCVTWETYPFTLYKFRTMYRDAG